MSTDIQAGRSRRSLLGWGLASAAVGVATITQASPAYATPVALDSAEIARRVEEIGVYVSAGNFPNIFPDGSADSTAGLAAAIATVPDNGVAVVAPGTYLVSGPVNGGRGNIRILGYGATLVQTAPAPVFAVAPTWPAATAVTAIVLADEPSNDPGAAATTLTSKITTAAESNLRVGQVFKIVSDDAIEDARTEVGAQASRLGEYAVVKRINGTTLFTVGRLREPYVTNIRLVAVPTDTIDVRGFTVQTDDTGLATPGGYGPIFSLTGLFRPRIADIRCPQASGTVLSMQGCYNYVIDGIDIGYAVNNTSGSPALGYAVLDQCSTGGVVQNSSMRFVRHAYTDDTPRLAGSTNEYWNYGRSYGNKIVNCHSLGSSATAFDTHHASENIHFISCTASSGGAGAAGFQLRGKSHVISNCRADWMDIGVIIFTEGVRGGRSWGHVINDVSLFNIQKTALSANINPTGHENAGQRETRMNAFIDGLVVWNARWAIDCVNAMIDVRNSRFTIGEGVAGTTYALVRNRNSSITLTDAVFDARSNTVGGIQYIYSSQNSGQGSLNALTLRNVLVQQTQSVATRADRFLVGAGLQVIMDEVIFDYPFRIMPGSFAGTSSMKWRCQFDPTIARSDLSSSFHYFEGDLTAELTLVWASEDENVTIQLKPTGAQTLAAFPAGRRRAQRLNIFCTGTGTVIINNGAAYKTRNLLKGALTVKPDTTVSYFWDGTVWRQIS